MDPVPPLVVELAKACQRHGGRALLNGGGVRDAMLGRPINDWDVEVYGIPEPDLADLLAKLGRVSAVGRAFGVYKLARGRQEIDVSLPRRDSKVGAGHRGIHVDGDPSMSFEEAARRRDLTVNAMLRDPLSGEIIDPWGGQDDLRARVLRAVDATTFLEDPLRALRVVQLAARLDFEVDPVLESLCAQAALGELPPERIQGEWLKLLLLGVRPSRGLALARKTAILARVFPEAVDALDADSGLDHLAAGHRDGLEDEGRRVALMLATWLHGTPSDQVEATLDRLWLHRWKGYPLRERVLGAIATWSEEPTSDVALRHLATRTELELTLLVQHGVTGRAAPLQQLDRAMELGIAHGAPEPLLKGRDLKPLGVSPGPAMGTLLRQVYELQLDGAVTSPDEALDAARRLIGSTHR